MFYLASSVTSALLTKKEINYRDEKQIETVAMPPPKPLQTNMNVSECENFPT